MRQKYVTWHGSPAFSADRFVFLSRHVPRCGGGTNDFSCFFKNFSQKAETAVSAALGQKLPASNPVREALKTYVQLAGIETGYGYFAPNVPGGYRLVFELHYPDGRVEYELPSVSSAAAGLRIAGLLDNIGRTPYDALREILVKTLAQSVWREHPDVESVRAILGSIRLPTAREFERENENRTSSCTRTISLSRTRLPKRKIAKRMQSVKTDCSSFCFLPSTDNWLAILRIGLGLEVTLYSLSLRNDWIYLLSGTARKVAEALLSLESHFVPRLGWFVASAAQLGIHEEAVLFLAWACLLSCRLRSCCWSCLPVLSNCSVVFTPVRGEKRRLRLLWDG